MKSTISTVLLGLSVAGCGADDSGGVEDVMATLEQPHIGHWIALGRQEGGFGSLKADDRTDDGVNNQRLVASSNKCYTASNKTTPAAGYDFRATLSGSSSDAWAGVPWVGTYAIPKFWAGADFNGTATFNGNPKAGASSGATCKGTLVYHIDVAESMRARHNYSAWVWMAWGVFNGAFADNFMDDQQSDFGVDSQQTIPPELQSHCDDAEKPTVMGDGSNRDRVPYVGGELWVKLCRSRTSSSDCVARGVLDGDSPGVWKTDPWGSDYNWDGVANVYCNVDKAFTFTRPTSGYQYVWSLDVVSTAGHGHAGAPVEATVWSCPSSNPSC